MQYPPLHRAEECPIKYLYSVPVFCVYMLQDLRTITALRIQSFWIF